MEVEEIVSRIKKIRDSRRKCAINFDFASLYPTTMRTFDYPSLLGNKGGDDNTLHISH